MSESKNKIAILILAHKNPRQVCRLIRAMDSQYYDFFIHIDAKCEDLPFKELINRLKLTSKVFFVQNRVKTYFFDFSLIEATCQCMNMAFYYKRYKYYILLSGQDYPIKSKDYIYEKLINNYPMCWIDMYDVEKAVRCGIKWVEHIGYNYVSQNLRRIFLNLLGSRFYFSRYGKCVKLFAVIYDRLRTLLGYSPRRMLKSKTNYKYSAGSHFWMLPDIAVEHVLSCFFCDKLLNNIFRHVAAPEESYFQTTLTTMDDLLVPNAYTQYCSIESEMDNPALRLIKWYEESVKTNGHPAIWRLKDFLFITKAKALFARKFDDTIDSKILDRLDEYISCNL